MCDSNSEMSTSLPWKGLAKFWHLYTSPPDGTSKLSIVSVTVWPPPPLPVLALVDVATELVALVVVAAFEADALVDPPAPLVEEEAPVVASSPLVPPHAAAASPKHKIKPNRCIASS